MSQFSDLITRLEADAKAEWQRVEAAGEQIVQELVPVVEDAFSSAVADFGQLAVATVISFMKAEFAVITGQEKQGNVVTALIQTAEAQAKTLAIGDAQALAKSAYLAVVGTAPG